MRRPSNQILVLSSIAILFLCSCGNGKNDPNAGAPPPLKVERAEDRNLFSVKISLREIEKFGRAAKKF